MQWSSWLWCLTCSVYLDSTLLSYVCRRHWDYGHPYGKSVPEFQMDCDDPGNRCLCEGKAWWNLRTLCFGFFLSSFFTRRMFPADVVTKGWIERCPFWNLKVPIPRVLNHRWTALRLTGGCLSDVYKSEWMMVSKSPNCNRTFA